MYSTFTRSFNFYNESDCWTDRQRVIANEINTLGFPSNEERELVSRLHLLKSEREERSKQLQKIIIEDEPTLDKMYDEFKNWPCGTEKQFSGGGDRSVYSIIRDSISNITTLPVLTKLPHTIDCEYGDCRTDHCKWNLPETQEKYVYDTRIQKYPENLNKFSGLVNFRLEITNPNRDTYMCPGSLPGCVKYSVFVTRL